MSASFEGAALESSATGSGAIGAPAIDGGGIDAQAIEAAAQPERPHRGAELTDALAAARARSRQLVADAKAVLDSVAATLARIEAAGPMPRASDREEVARLLEEVANLRQALESRAVIEQAKGVLIARTGCTAEAAFELLVRQSQYENRKVREVAAELVAANIKRPSNG